MFFSLVFHWLHWEAKRMYQARGTHSPVARF